jgi:hypothetical protein
LFDFAIVTNIQWQPLDGGTQSNALNVLSAHDGIVLAKRVGSGSLALVNTNTRLGVVQVCVVVD